MATPLMLARELLCILPSDAKVHAADSGSKDVLLRIETCGGYGHVLISGFDRILSLDSIREKYKPRVDAILMRLWAGEKPATGPVMHSYDASASWQS